MKQPGIALILSGFPRRSETFALNETLALARRGLLAGLFATKPGDNLPPQPGSQALLDKVYYLPDRASAAEQASQVVQQLAGRTVMGVHAYFAHVPTDVAMLVAERLGVPFGMSAHAKDIRKVSPAALAARVTKAAYVVACNSDTAQEIRNAGGQPHLLPHGVDLEHFQPQPLPPHAVTRLLAVGRLVEKKGFHVLIRAASQLTIPFHLRIVGDGPLRAELMNAIHTAGLARQVELCGGMTHDELAVEYANAHIVVVPSVVDSSGDRDGLPNVVLEAMASGRMVMASNVAAISSAVEPGQTGFLLRPGDDTALARALNFMGQRPQLYAELGRNARHLVEHTYDLLCCTERFCDFVADAFMSARHKTGLRGYRVW
ncbi:MAG: glycosyltransferase family 4 protein [Caldilineaceae bacterium]|nr:glycosyltransferase family 4 protein [Caldilineaceae bacterium]MCB0094530.1 glycosyltransferase family 4 protein [Caldilineaceae bacterium]MCB0138325.1 glycosyltransferase family 4 protein [Caldilineaceae bacterium]